MTKNITDKSISAILTEGISDDVDYSRNEIDDSSIGEESISVSISVSKISDLQSSRECACESFNRGCSDKNQIEDNLDSCNSISSNNDEKDCSLISVASHRTSQQESSAIDSSDNSLASSNESEDSNSQKSQIGSKSYQHLEEGDDDNTEDDGVSEKSEESESEVTKESLHSSSSVATSTNVDDGSLSIDNAQPNSESKLSDIGEDESCYDDNLSLECEVNQSEPGGRKPIL